MAIYQTQKFTDVAEGLAWAWAQTFNGFEFTTSHVNEFFSSFAKEEENVTSLMTQELTLFNNTNILLSVIKTANRLAEVQAHVDTLAMIWRGIRGFEDLRQTVTQVGSNLVRVTIDVGVMYIIGDVYVNLPEPPLPPTVPVYIPIIQGYPIPFNITVKFNADGGSPTPANQTIAWQYDDFDIGSEIAAVSTPSLTSHIFQGWYYNGLLVSTDGQTFSGIPSSQFSINDITITLNASWLAAIAKGGYIIV